MELKYELLHMGGGTVVFGRDIVPFSSIPFDYILSWFMEYRETRFRITVSRNEREFIEWFTRNEAVAGGYVFPVLPPKEFVIEYKERNTYYKYSKEPREVKTIVDGTEYTEYVYDPLLDENGDKIIDWEQQEQLVKNINMLLFFYSWYDWQSNIGVRKGKK